MSDAQSESVSSSMPNKVESVTEKPSTDVIKKSGIRPPVVTRIGRPCCMNRDTTNAGPENVSKDDTNMKRQSNEFNPRSHLSDVCEESETEVLLERLPSRFTMSGSPDPERSPNADKKLSDASNNSDSYMEATGRRRSSDHGVILTTDTDSFIIGQKVWVGGVRAGQIAYIGETHFAPGEWAGVVLEEPSGKNDGCVAGKRYFQCEPKRGIFSRLTRLTREPLKPGSNATLSISDVSVNASCSTRSPTSPLRTDSVSPTQSVKSLITKTPAKSQLAVGDRVIVSSGLGSRPGILQFLGETQFAPGTWCGVQLDDATGKNDGSVGGVKYFECPQHYGIFVPIAKVSLSPSSRKSRISRSGSVESLNSICTVDSVTSTATSRMRQSMQRLPPGSAKPISTQKNTFSLQDVLREKQNHIEQLLLERDLDRQDAESQLFASQKTINGLKEKVANLEKVLEDEKRKTEDLQFSIDEATYCRDDISSVQEAGKIIATDKEKELSNEIEKLKLEIINVKEALAAKESQLCVSAENEKVLNAEIQKLNEKWKNDRENIEQVLKIEIRNLEEKNAEYERISIERQGDFEKELAEMKVNQEQQQDRIMNLQDELKLREAIVANYDGELKEMMADKESFEKRCQQISEAKDQLTIELQEKIEEFKSLQMSDNSTNEENTNLLNENVKLKASNTERSVEIESLQKLLDGKTESVKSLEDRFEQLQNEIINLQQNLVERDNLIQKQNEEEQKLKTEALELNEQIKKLDEEKSKFVQSLGKEKDEMVRDLSQNIESLTKDNAKLSKEKSDLEINLKKQLELLENQVTLTQKLEVNNKEICIEKEKLVANVDSLAKDVQNKIDLIEKLTQNVDELNATVQSKINEIQNEQQKFNVKSDETKHAQSERDRLQSEINSIQESTKLEFIKKDEQIQKLEKEIVHFKDQEQISLQEKEQLEHKVNAITNVSEEFKNEIEIKTKKEQNLEKNLNTKIVEIEKLLQQNNEITSKLQSTRDQETLLQNNLSKLEIEYADLGRKLTVCETKLEHISNEKFMLQENLEALQNSSTNTNSEVLRLSEQLKQKQTQLDESIDRSNTQKLDLEKRLHEAQQTIASLSSQYEKAIAEMESISSEKISRENELNTELCRIKEDAESEKNQLHERNINVEKEFSEEKKSLMSKIDVLLKESDSSKTKLMESISLLECQVQQLNQQLENEQNSFSAKEKEFVIKEAELKTIETTLKTELESLKMQKEATKSDGDRQIDELKQEKDQLATKLKDQQMLSENHNLEISKLNDQLKISAEKLSDFDGKLRQSQIDLETLEAKFTNEKAELETILSDLRSKYKLVEDEQVDLVDRNEQLEKEIESWKNQCFKFDLEIKAKNEEITLKQTELQTSEANSKDLQEKLETQLQKFEETDRLYLEKIQTFENQITILTQNLNSKTDESQNHMKIFEDLKDDTEKHRLEFMEQHKMLEDKLTECQMKITEKEEIIQILESKVGQLTSSVNLSDDLKNELNHKSEEIRSKDNSITELNSMIHILRTEINGKVIELKQCIDEKEIETKKSLDELSMKNDEIKQYKDEVQRLNENVREQLEKLSKSLEENSQLSVEKEDLKKKLTDLNCRLTELDALNAAEKTAKAEEQSQLQSLKMNYEELEIVKDNEIDDLRLQIKQMEDKIKKHGDVMKLLEDMNKRERDLFAVQEQLKCREAQLSTENKILQEKINTMKVTPIVTGDDDIGAQISFLNSIIADMQNKNETLIKRVQTLEATTDFVNNGLFDVPIKRKPAPRLFCDICDIFDAHETEDCPLQSSDSPPPPPSPQAASSTSGNEIKKKEIPPPRKYCECCEVFGHDIKECTNEETF